MYFILKNWNKLHNIIEIVFWSIKYINKSREENNAVLLAKAWKKKYPVDFPND